MVGKWIQKSKQRGVAESGRHRATNQFFFLLVFLCMGFGCFLIFSPFFFSGLALLRVMVGLAPHQEIFLSSDLANLAETVLSADICRDLIFSITGLNNRD